MFEQKAAAALIFISARFVNLDCQTPLFLPCDLREWLPADPLVHFRLDAEQIPTGHFRINHRGTGSEQDPPLMMLALLIYCHATGRFGSRAIEVATHSDVAVRYLCANLHPDHDSICVFRTAAKTTPRHLAGNPRKMLTLNQSPFEPPPTRGIFCILYCNQSPISARIKSFPTQPLG